MSIQKHLNPQPYLKALNLNPINQYRVRNLFRGQSMKQLHSENASKRNILSRINNKYTLQTSFFLKENVNILQVQSEQDLPKYSINVRKQPQKIIKRNASHRILRKAESHQILPQSAQSIINFTSVKDSILNNQNRKVSLKKKVELIKKKHNEDKSRFFVSQPTDIQSQQLLGQKKKERSKLKILVRDPFQPRIHQRRKAEMFFQSKIQPQNDTSLISESNRQQLQQFLSCLN